jgi:hypothetical protein
MGQFAQLTDVQAEYEGVIPASRQAWVEAKIGAVEARLVGLVPSLATFSEDQDPARFERVKFLVTEKVLELYRNPAGSRAVTVMGQSNSWDPAVSSGRIAFTPEELSTVRMRKRKANLGTAKVQPWRRRGSGAVFGGC